MKNDYFTEFEMKIKFYFYGSNNKNKYNSYLHNYKKLNDKIVKKIGILLVKI
jgi:hypothetical protein